MLNVSTLTSALYNALIASQDMSGVTIERSTRINFDPAIAMLGWVGVYPGTVSTAPRTVGANWKDAGSLQVVAQSASFDTDADASDMLESLIESITDVINTDLTLGIQGVRVVGFDREYRYVVFDDDGAGSIFMPQAVINVKFEARSN
jgi:hypothetical protein